MDRHHDQRLRLEDQRRELSTNIGNPAWMRDHGRATLARLSVERGWRRCAENEAEASAKRSERPARLLAEEALVRCGEWKRLLRLALDNGAYPYLKGHVTKLDMIALAELESRDSALARISMWRAGSLASVADDDDSRRREPGPPVPAIPPASGNSSTPAIPPSTEGPKSPAAEEGDEETIVVTASRRWGCRVRLADRTLTERQLEANAKKWAANKTPLRVIRPPGADYNCLAKIVWSLSKHGVKLFHFVRPSEAK